MADGTGKDPFGLWRDMIGQWEKGMNAIANETMASDQYSRSVNAMMNVSLNVQRALGESMAAYLTALNLPSKGDIGALGERLASIEHRLDRIVALAEHAVVERPSRNGVPPEPAVAMPPRTKKPKNLKKL